MDYHYVLLALGVTLSVATPQFDLPEIIYDICPYSEICNRTASKSLNVKGLIPCCSSCKCDDQCGLRLDCCFDDLDKYRLKDKGIVACVNSVIGDEVNSTFRDGYWMIQTCRNDTGNYFQNNSYIPCELNNVRGQSFVEPVSSKEKESIYVNEECAKCNNVYNYTTWNYLFLDYHYEVGPFKWESRNDKENPVERIAYIPPLNENWSMKRCVRKVAETCNTNSTLEKLCHTLNLPFQQFSGTRHRNPFCFMLCDYDFNIGLKECKAGVFRGFSLHLTVLIDNSVIAYSKLRQNVMIKKVLKTGCLKETSVHSNSCFQIYCPDGMLMTETGCRYFIRRWHIPSFRIQFKLWAIIGNELPLATLDKLTQEERKNPLLWMKQPCRKVKATVIEVFYEIGKGGRKTVHSFIVRLWKLTPAGIDPSVLIPILGTCLKYNWYINILGETYAFYPTLDKHSTYIQDGKQVRVNKLTDEKEPVPSPKLYERISTGPESLRFINNVMVRAKMGPALWKTFFCDQISLSMDQVEVLYGEIRILSKNVTLGDNEFAFNLFGKWASDGRYIADHNKTTIFVCLEDYDHSYYNRRSGSAMSLRAFLFEQLVIYYTTLQLII